MSRSQLNTLLIGLSLIGAGIFYLVYNMGLIPEPSPQTWILIMAGASVYFFVCFFLTGIHNWGWLFPAFILTGTAGTIWLAESNAIDELVAIPVLAGVGLPFLAVYLLDRKQWWALIPCYVMAVVIGIVLSAELLPGEMIATFVLWSIAFPFLVVYLVDRKQWWALIPAGILAMVGLIPPLSTMLHDEAMAGMVLFLISLPFFVIYFLSAKNWWALIPAGIMTSIGLGVFLLGFVENESMKMAVMNGVMYFGWGLTFGFLWLRRQVQPTGWAIYPAVGFMGAGIVGFITRSNISQFWPIILILVGAFLLVRGVMGRK